MDNDILKNLEPLNQFTLNTLTVRGKHEPSFKLASQIRLSGRQAKVLNSSVDIDNKKSHTTNITSLEVVEAMKLVENNLVGTKVSPLSHSTDHAEGCQMISGVSGAMKEKNLRELMERTGYPIEQLQGKGQRIYGPPPHGHHLYNKGGSRKGCEVFVGRLPRDCFEDELVPVMERAGPVYEMRMMMEYSGKNRGFCFVCYCDAASARRAVKELNDVEIRSSRKIGVVQSVDNCRIFLGGLPRDKKKEDVLQIITKLVDNVQDVILRADRADKNKNRGFAFVEFTSHNNAAIARKKLLDKGLKLWEHTIAVDWAEPEPEVDPEIMKKVKVLYMHNLMLTTTEETIGALCEQVLGRSGAVEKVKKSEDYAFVHFQEREDAARVMQALKGTNVDGANIEIAWSKPPKKEASDNKFQESLLPSSSLILPHTPLGSKDWTKKRERGRVRGAGGLARVYSRPTSSSRSIRSVAPMHENSSPFLKNTVIKAATQVFMELCVSRGWGLPEYKVSEVVVVVEEGKELTQYLAEAVLPWLPHISLPQSPVCKSNEDAVQFAAFNALKQLSESSYCPPAMLPLLSQNQGYLPVNQLPTFYLPPPPLSPSSCYNNQQNLNNATQSLYFGSMLPYTPLNSEEPLSNFYTCNLVLQPMPITALSFV